VAPPQVGGRGAASEELRAKVLEAIDEGLKDVLGESCAKSIYYYFQMCTGLRVEDVVERPEAFVSFLRDMFKAGAQVLERKVVERLCTKFGVNPGDVRGVDLVSLIRMFSSKK